MIMELVVNARVKEKFEFSREAKVEKVNRLIFCFWRQPQRAGISRFFRHSSKDNNHQLAARVDCLQHSISSE
jgi:hypothetical protein